VDREEQSVPVLACTANQEQDLVSLPQKINSTLTKGEAVRLMMTKTLVHELGHVVDTGELDERDGVDEVYSGKPDGVDEDYTPERTELNGSIQTEWSVMGNGKLEEMFYPPMNGSYYAFSIEELLSIRSDEEDDYE